MSENSYAVEPIGKIRSELTDRANAPLQGDEGSYEAWLELTPQAAPGAVGITIGDKLIVLTWLHLAQRDVLQVQPRGRLDAPLTGVFATAHQIAPTQLGCTRFLSCKLKGSV